MVSLKTEPGTHVAYGFNVMTNTGTSAITDITAELIPEKGHSYDGVAFDTVKVIEIDKRGLGYLGAGQWPFEDLDKSAQPLSGYVLPADGKRVEILFVANVQRAGRWVWPKTQVSYQYENHRYVEQVTHGFVVCADGATECGAHSS